MGGVGWRREGWGGGLALLGGWGGWRYGLGVGWVGGTVCVMEILGQKLASRLEKMLKNLPLDKVFRVWYSSSMVKGSVWVG